MASHASDSSMLVQKVAKQVSGLLRKNLKTEYFQII